MLVFQAIQFAHLYLSQKSLSVSNHSLPLSAWQCPCCVSFAPGPCSWQHGEVPEQEVHSLPGVKIARCVSLAWVRVMRHTHTHTYTHKHTRSHATQTLRPGSIGFLHLAKASPESRSHASLLHCPVIWVNNRMPQSWAWRWHLFVFNYTYTQPRGLNLRSEWRWH